MQGSLLQKILATINEGFNSVNSSFTSIISCPLSCWRMAEVLIHFPQPHFHIEPGALSVTELIPAAALPFNRLQMPVDDVSILINEKILLFEMESFREMYGKGKWPHRESSSTTFEFDLHKSLQLDKAVLTLSRLNGFLSMRLHTANTDCPPSIYEWLYNW